MHRVVPALAALTGFALVAACGGDPFTNASSSPIDGAAEAAVPGDDVSTGPLGADAGDATTRDAGPPEGAAAPGADARVDAPGEASMPGPGCPTGHGPVMILVDGFCIDSTEVTESQYNAFLLSGPALTGQPSECSWNTSYLPGNGWTYDPSQATWPIASVNWCKAYAFCKWAGKRLCGKVGGGAADFNQFASRENEHYVACSNVGTRVYPYGNTFDSTACNGLERDAGQVTPVGSLAGCQGGVPGLFDMSGNVEEWQDACNGSSGMSDQCLDGTGAYDYGGPPDGTRCDFSDSDLRNGEYPNVGFRCCATPP